MRVMKSIERRRLHRRAVNTLTQLLSEMSVGFALISFLVLGTTTSYAETVTVTGANGAPDMPGSDAVANAGPGPGPDATNTANAYGGTGGPCSFIFCDVVNGGNAASTAITSVSTGPASAFSNASGGTGGDSVFGTGGNGGSATATASATASSNNPATASAVAIGGGSGQSGEVDLPPAPAGGGGAATASGTSGSGTVNVTATVQGGSVGFLTNGVAADGASVTLNNAVSGSTTGSLNLYQNAYAGNGGGIAGAGAPGKGGNASSILSVLDTSASSLLGSTVATGGIGGLEHLGGAPGGRATATTVLTGVSGMCRAKAPPLAAPGALAEEGGIVPWVLQAAVPQHLRR